MSTAESLNAVITRLAFARVVACENTPCVMIPRDEFLALLAELRDIARSLSKDWTSEIQKR